MAIVKPTMLGTTERMNFAKINEVLEMPNLIDVQKSLKNSSLYLYNAE